MKQSSKLQSDLKKSIRFHFMLYVQQEVFSIKNNVMWLHVYTDNGYL